MTKHKSLRVKIAIVFLHLLSLDYILGVAFPEGIQTSLSVTSKEMSLSIMALMLVTRNTLREDGKDDQIELLKRFADTVFVPAEEEEK